MPVVMFLLILLLFVAGIVVAVLLMRRREPGEPDSGTCAACGYAVRGVSALQCPECGADLRMVGIQPPTRGTGRRSGMGAAIGAAVVVVVVVLLLGLMFVSTARMVQTPSSPSRPAPAPAPVAPTSP